MKFSTILKLVAAVIIPLAVGGLAGFYTVKEIPGWYSQLNAPSFSPPNWVFGPVWTILYVLMGYSSYLILGLRPGIKRSSALRLYAIQLVLNGAWSFLFFHFHAMGWALIDIAILLLAVVIMIKKFYAIHPMAAYINIPYLLWVAFASCLNASYFWLNR